MWSTKWSNCRFGTLRVKKGSGRSKSQHYPTWLITQLPAGGFHPLPSLCTCCLDSIEDTWLMMKDKRTPDGSRVPDGFRRAHRMMLFLKLSVRFCGCLQLNVKSYWGIMLSSVKKIKSVLFLHWQNKMSSLKKGRDIKFLYASEGGKERNGLWASGAPLSSVGWA